MAGQGRGAKSGYGRAFGKENLRKCHTPGCNNMTPNYRCKECWVRLQGFAPYERSDYGMDVATAGQQTSKRGAPD